MTRKLLFALAALLGVASGASAQSTRATLQQFNDQNINANGRGLITGPIANSMNSLFIDSFGALSDNNTWTAANTFNGGITFNGTGAFSGANTFAGASTFSGPSTFTGAVTLPSGTIIDNLVNANGTFVLTNTNTNYPAVFFQGQGAPNTGNSTAEFTNDGTTESSIIGAVYGNTISSVMNMCSVASSTCPDPFVNSSLLQQNAGSFTVVDAVPQGPAATATAVGSNTITFASLPAHVTTGIAVADVSALNGNSIATAVAATANGTGGTNGSAIYTVSGGTCTVQPTVNAIWTSGVLSFNASSPIQNAGQCTSPPSTGASLTYSSGAATGWTGATVTLTTAPTYGCILGTSCGLSGARTISSISGQTITLSGSFGTTVNVGDTIKFYAASGGGSDNGVAIQMNANCDISYAACWDYDFQAGNNANQHSANIEGIEGDILNNQVDAGINGINLIGVSTQSGVSSAFSADLMDVTGLQRARWGTAFYAEDGCCSFGVLHPAANFTGANNPGAPDEWFASDGNSNAVVYEEIATAQGFEYGCQVTTPTTCQWDYGGPIAMYGSASYDLIIAMSSDVLVLGGNSAVTGVNIGNATAPTTIQGSLVLAGSASFNNNEGIYGDGDLMLLNNGHVVTVASGASITSTAIGSSTQTVNLLATTLEVNGTAGVTCPTGSPSSSFATIKGVVTHC